MSYEINVLFYGIKDIVTVFFCQGRQIDADTRNIYTLAASQSGIVTYFTEQGLIILVDNNHIQLTVIHQDMGTDRQIMNEVGITHCNTIMSGSLLRFTYNLGLITSLEINRTFHTSCCTDFRTFGIHQNADTV